MADIDITGYNPQTSMRGTLYDEGITRILFGMCAETARDGFTASDIVTFLEKTEQRIPAGQRKSHLWDAIFSAQYREQLDIRLDDIARRTGFLTRKEDGTYTPTGIGLLHVAPFIITEPYATASVETIQELYPKAP